MEKKRESPANFLSLKRGILFEQLFLTTLVQLGLFPFLIRQKQ
jgi:hypothetical protein